MLIDYEYSVFVPEILQAQNSVKIMQIRERNEEGMQRASPPPTPPPPTSSTLALRNARKTLGKVRDCSQSNMLKEFYICLSCVCKRLVKKYYGGGGGPEQRGGGSSDFEPLVRGGSFNFQLALRGGSSFFYGN